MDRVSKRFAQVSGNDVSLAFNDEFSCFSSQRSWPFDFHILSLVSERVFVSNLPHPLAVDRSVVADVVVPAVERRARSGRGSKIASSVPAPSRRSVRIGRLVSQSSNSET